VHVHDERVPAATAGSRVALNLAGVERKDVSRGDVVLGGGDGPTPTHYIDATVELLPGAGGPLRRGMRVHVHHGTRDSPARVEPLEAGLVQLRLERPLMPLRGDRFVLRRIAPPGTIGGGEVLDPAPRKHGPGGEHVRRLRALESADPLEALRLELEAAPSGLAADDPGLLAQLHDAGEAAVAGRTRPRWFTPAALARARQEVLRAVSGTPAGAGALARTVSLDAAAVAALLEDLTAAGEVNERSGMFSAANAPRALDDPLARRLADALEDDGVTPRAPDALAAAAGTDRDSATRALDRLAAAGVVVRLRPGVYIASGALESAREAVVERCRRVGAVTIAQLRDDLGTSRKAAQAILEHLDSRRFTRRQGDAHVLRSR
jgi:selenocysteine-specific elongation factor